MSAYCFIFGASIFFPIWFDLDENRCSLGKRKMKRIACAFFLYGLLLQWSAAWFTKKMEKKFVSAMLVYVRLFKYIYMNIYIYIKREKKLITSDTNWGFSCRLVLLMISYPGCHFVRFLIHFVHFKMTLRKMTPNIFCLVFKKKLSLLW